MKRIIIILAILAHPIKVASMDLSSSSVFVIKLDKYKQDSDTACVE